MGMHAFFQQSVGLVAAFSLAADLGLGTEALGLVGAFFEL